MNGTIFNIQRFCINDGQGIRTAVFLKGCPLRCAWCHNPESQSKSPQLMFDREKCTGCGKCRGITEKDSDFVCKNGAKEICGREISDYEIISEVLKDRIFYENSGGGITLTGGEPLMQYDFSLSVLKKAKENGLNTAIETCGYTEKSLFKISEYVDFWLYDIKLLDDGMHKKYTGVPNEKILENLKYLDSIGASVILRCPIIPEINMTKRHFSAIAELKNSLTCVKAIHLMPYHPMGISKSERLGKKQAYSNKEFLEKSELKPFADMLKKSSDTNVQIM